MAIRNPVCIWDQKNDNWNSIDLSLQTGIGHLLEIDGDIWCVATDRPARSNLGEFFWILQQYPLAIAIIDADRQIHYIKDLPGQYFLKYKDETDRVIFSNPDGYVVVSKETYKLETISDKSAFDLSTFIPLEMSQTDQKFIHFFDVPQQMVEIKRKPAVIIDR